MVKMKSIPLGLGIAAALLIGLFSQAQAGIVEGTLAFPRQFIPSMLIYAREVDSLHIVSIATHADQTSFRLELPPGRYVFFAEPNEPGAPDVYGAFTRYSLCKRHPAAACEDHTLSIITLGAKSTASVQIDDWDLSDALYGELDRMLGITESPSADELGAPRFSEYPAPPEPEAAAPTIEPGSIPAEDRARIKAGIAGGPNFAGHLSAITLPCGPTCHGVLIVDWHGGKVHAPAALASITDSLPCRTDEAVQFRRDSRLLSVTRKRGATITTQYFVWTLENVLTQTAQYERTPERFCSTP
jgi:hypothetical protein